MNVVTVSVDPSDTADVLRAYQRENGYPWIVTPGNAEIVQTYNVMATMYKLGVARDGTVAARGGHDVEDAMKWQQRFEELVRR